MRTRSVESHDYRDLIFFVKLRFPNTSRPNENAKATFSNFSDLKSSVFVTDQRTEDLTVEMKLRFQNFSSVRGVNRA